MSEYDEVQESLDGQDPKESYLPRRRETRGDCCCVFSTHGECTHCWCCCGDNPDEEP